MEFQAKYGEEFADHLPMARRALHRMGAAPSRIDEFTKRYVRDKHLRPLADAPIEAGARASVLAALEHDGCEAVLQRDLPELMPGVGAAAFHPLIRLGYAIEAGDDGEVAAALVYWRDALLDLGFAAYDAPTTFRPEAAFERLRAVLDGIALPGGLIHTRMAVAAADPRFAGAVHAGGRARDAYDLRAIARFAIAWFAGTGDFVALHAMTAVHALRLVTPYLDLSTALPPVWWAICAAYAAGKRPAFGEPGALEAPSWEAIFAAAVASDDEHVIKAAYTAWSEERAYGGELYRPAAARYARLIA